MALVLERYPRNVKVSVSELSERSDVSLRKARITLILLKRHGLVREYRGGSWERLEDDLTSVDLGEDLHSYEERRARDRRKLDAMVNYCQTVHCRTRYILEYFGARLDDAWRCEQCDNCLNGRA